MKRTLMVVAVLLLTAGVASAEDDFAGGGCMLPDLAGLTPDQAAVAALAQGFEMSSAVAAAIPVCPVTFHCNSITNCGIGLLCAFGDLGPCCTSGGFNLCCISGTIKVRSCPCKCTGSPCNVLCPQSNEVTWRCA